MNEPMTDERWDDIETRFHVVTTEEEREKYSTAILSDMETVLIGQDVPELLCEVGRLRDEAKRNTAPHHLSGSVIINAMRKRIAKLEAALKMAQWGTQGDCVYCDGDETAGHHPDCSTGKALKGKP